MTNEHARQLTLTPTEAEKFNALAAGEPMWIVREGDWYAYAVGEPLPIVAFGDWLRDETISPRCVVVADGNIYIRGAGFPVPNITDRLAHYDLATLPGQWAIEVRKA